VWGDFLARSFFHLLPLLPITIYATTKGFVVRWRIYAEVSARIGLKFGRLFFELCLLEVNIF
jgi:hypothetical protein